MAMHEVFGKKEKTQETQEPRMTGIPVKTQASQRQQLPERENQLEAGCVLSVLEEMKKYSKPDGNLQTGHPSKAGHAMETATTGQRNFNHYCHDDPNRLCERMDNLIKKNSK